MQRTLEPELLDSLPPDHPDALHNRRDLRLVNIALGSHRWITRKLPPLLQPGEQVLEIGAGTGELGLRLARQHLTVAGLDLNGPPCGYPAKAAGLPPGRSDVSASGSDGSPSTARTARSCRVSK